MTRAVTLLVIAGIVGAGLLGYAVGLDVAGITILACLVGVGALAITITRKSATGIGGPARCVACGGLMSPNAPYCKHCGEQVAAPSR